ncbi:MAG: cyclic-di-AMP receptor [Oscillospiraceae bacterium]|nr:cyclic-di-AMP receptor [Oscillospiraceae bacterium]
MKLIFAVVNGDDSAAVSKSLAKNGFRATKLASTGSFLSSGNTTFLICVEEHEVDTVIGIVQQKCHHRKQFVPSTPTYGTPVNGTVPAMPLEVPVGGATVFVTNIERFEKL